MKHWEDFYRGGALATGPTGADGLYDLEVATAWQTFFRSLPAKAKVLDIGTGNGVLALMARQHADASAQTFEIDAIDLALVDPAKHVPAGSLRFRGIRFHPGVAMERTPFADASFDGVMGHYALEYGDIAKSLAEVRRTLKPGGKAQFIIHHRGSTLVRTARRSLEESDVVLRGERFYRKLAKLISLDGASAATLSAAQEDFVRSLRALRARLEEARAAGQSGRVFEVAIDGAQKLLEARRTHPASTVGIEVGRAEESVRLAVRRLSDLIDAARDQEGIDAMAGIARAEGLRVTRLEELRHDVRHVVGWWTTLERD